MSFQERKLAGLLALEFILSNLQAGNAVGLSWSQDVCGTRPPACGSRGALYRAHAGCMATWSGQAAFPLPYSFQTQKVLSWGPTCHCGLWPGWSWTESSPGERGTGVSSFLTI